MGFQRARPHFSGLSFCSLEQLASLPCALSDTERARIFIASQAHKHPPGDLLFSKHIYGSVFSSAEHILHSNKKRENPCDVMVR